MAPGRQRNLGDTRVTLYTVFGVLFTLLGIIALVRPNFTLPAKTNEVMIQNQRVLIKTSRVISIPRVASATEVVLGIGLIFFSSRRRRSG